MKKLLLFVCAMALSLGAFAQKGQSAVGLSLNASPVNESGVSITNFGLSAKYQYGITDPIRLEATVGYDFKAKGVSVLTAGVNGHWLFNVGKKIKVYPIVGFGYANIKGYISMDDMEGALDNYDKWYGNSYNDYDDDEISNSSSKFYYNVGVGGEYAISDHLSASLEVKYQGMKWFNRIPISIGVSYKF